MPIRVQCGKCKTALAVKDHLAGKRVRCPKCQMPLAVPEPGTNPPAPMPVAKPAAKAPVAQPARPLKTAKAPAVPAVDLEAEALAALRDEPTNGHGANGTNGSAANGAAPPANGAAGAPIKFPCEFCDAEIEFPADMAGKRGQCPECRQLVKVPVPKVEKPKDWRTVETKGPSLAAANQPAKLDDAWGTETKGRVSQTALLEAGVIQKPKKRALRREDWIERGIKGGLLAILVGGIGWGVWKLGADASARHVIEKMPTSISEKLPSVMQGEFQLLIAELALRQPKSGDVARKNFNEAWQRNPAPKEPRDKIDRDYFLIRLAKSQVKLGGNDYDIASGDRFAWNQEVCDDIRRTIMKIESPEAKAQAVRELEILFAEHKQPTLALSLVPSGTPLQIAMLWADPAKQIEAKQILPFPDTGRTIDVVARCGYAEGLARQGKIDEALKLAQAPGQAPHKVQALLAVASYLAVDAAKDNTAKIKEACGEAAKLLEKDQKATHSPWLLVEHVRLMSRVDPDAAKALVEKLPAACKRRGQLEVALALLDKNPPPSDAAPLIRELDKEGPGRGLAWLTLARSKARANQSFNFTPEEPEEELLQPVFRAVSALPVQGP